MIDPEREALLLRLRALERKAAPVIPPPTPPPTAISIPFPSQTLPAGIKLLGLAGVPTGKLVHLWAILPWRVVAGSFNNAQWFDGGVQVGGTVGAQASASGGAQAITATHQFTGTFTGTPQLQLYSGVATTIDAFLVGGLVFG